MSLTPAIIAAAVIAATGMSGWAASQGAAAPPVETVLDRVSAYVTGFEKTLTGIVAEERYEQRLYKRVVIAGHTRTNQNPTTTRTLASDFLLVRTDDVVGWLPFRDVFAVDEEPVRDRDDRLAKLLLDPSGAGSNQARRIMEEGARYNIGRVVRTINVPTIGLRFFAADFRSRCAFRKDRDEIVDGIASVCIRFEEKTRPTLIRSLESDNLPSRGRACVDVGSGRVLQTVVENRHSNAEIRVSFGHDTRVGADVPVEMTERYVARDEELSGRATYSNFRRFKVETSETIR